MLIIMQLQRPCLCSGHCELAANVWNVWRQVFAGQTDRVGPSRGLSIRKPVVTSTRRSNQLVATSSPNDPNHGFDVISGGAYYDPNSSSFNAQTTVQQIEAAAISALNGQFDQQLQSFMSAAISWEVQLGRQIPVMMYEGGWGLTCPTTAPWYHAYVAAQTDPGMYQVTTAFLTELETQVSRG